MGSIPVQGTKIPHARMAWKWQLLRWDPHPHFYTPAPWTRCLGRAVSGPWRQRCYPVGCCGSSLLLLPPGFLSVSLGEWGGGLRFLGHREASRAWLLVGLGPFLLGPDPSIQISSLWGGEWQAWQGREEGEHIPWQLIVSVAGLACCRTPKQGGQGLCLPGLPRLRGWRWETLKSLL